MIRHAENIRSTSTVYQSEPLLQGHHYYTTQYPETNLLTTETNFHGVANDTLKRLWMTSPLKFLLKAEKIARDIIYEPAQKYPLRGSEGVTRKINFWGHSLALKAIYPNGLTGYKNINIFSDPIKKIFDAHSLKSTDYSAATPHALIRPWIDGLSLDVLFGRLEKTNKELADSSYSQLAENNKILSAHDKVFAELSRIIETFGFIQVTDNPQAKKQINTSQAAEFTKPGEEGLSILESEKIKMTVDFALPVPKARTGATLFENRIKSRLSNWILPTNFIRALLKAQDANLVLNLLLSNMICLDPFYIRLDTGYKDPFGQ